MSRLVIFDADGTLFDTRAITILNLRRTAEAMGFKTSSDEEMTAVLSKATSRGIADGLGLGPEEGETAIRTFFSISLSNPDDLSGPYPGIPELVADLRSEGYATAIASLKAQPLLDRLVASADMEFDSVRGVTGRSDTKADLIRRCLEDLNAAPGDAVMVGDTENDMAAAGEVGIPFIPVTYGFGFTPDDRGASDAGGIGRRIRDILRIV